MTEMYQNQNSTRCDDYLDMEYLTTLRNIKPYITCIMNNHFIELIRVWLEKLSDTQVQHDKTLRNVYLVELGQQIISGVFVEPFVDPPDNGPLPPFKNSWRYNKDKLQNVINQENTDAWTQSESNNVSVQVTVDSTKCSSQATTDLRTHTNNPFDEQFFHIKQEKDIPSPKNQLHDVREKLAMVREYSKEMYKGSKNAKKKKNRSKKQLNMHTVPQPVISDETDICRRKINDKRFETPYKEVRVYSPLRKIKAGDRKFGETDDSSWFDLTDCSTNYCSGDAEISARMYVQDDAMQMQELYEKKIAELVNLIAGLRQENANLNVLVEKCEKELKTARANSNLHTLAHDVEALKSQLQELINIKLNLQNGHFGVSADWQNTISTLHKKLSVLQRKNNEMKSENADLVKKLEEQQTDKRKLALTTQRADLLSHTANGKQNEIDLVVAQLEEYYKQKLIEHQQRALEEKRQDNKLIAELKDQLAKLNNEY